MRASAISYRQKYEDCRDQLVVVEAALQRVLMNIGAIYECPICGKRGYAHRENCSVFQAWQVVPPPDAAAPPQKATLETYRDSDLRLRARPVAPQEAEDG